MSSPPETDDSSITEDAELASLDPSNYRSRTGSFKSSALPHKHVSDGIEWEIVSCETDEGDEAPTEPTTNTISLIGLDWESVTLTVEARFPEWAYDLVFPPEEEKEKSENWTAKMEIVYWCRQTILRESSSGVSVHEPSSHELEVTVDRDRVHKSVKLQPALVRKESGSPDGEYASFAGHRIAEGEVWTLNTDLEKSTSNLLHPETKKFSEDDDLPSEDHLVFVDFDRDPPGVYLNGDHERIVAALDSDSNKGWDAAVREVAYDTIETEVWPQMILEAASDITEDGGPETSWKQGVIEKFREQIYGEGTTYEEALDLLREDLSDRNRLPRLMHDIDDAIQTRNDAPNHLNKLLNLVDNR
jgi:hypothetical protein